MLIIPVIKIMKLESVGVHSICVTSKNAKLVEIIEKGTYHFGEFNVSSQVTN